NRLEQQRLNTLVFIKYNIHLELKQSKRIEKGETYDLICLSNMELDDEWIIKMKNPCLPQENSLRISMNALRMKGLRLATKKKSMQFDAKRKSKIILQNEDIQPIVEEEENLQDEENEEMVVLKENEGSHDDNDLKLEEKGDDLERGDE
ncbi:hypothetical protein QQP08_018652, partial [Theobroma cacao]